MNANVPVFTPSPEDKEASKKRSAYQEKIKDFQRHLLRKHPQEDEDENLGFFSLITRTLDLMTMKMADQVLQNHQPDILFQISRDSCSMFDFYKAEEMVETGRQVARATLDSFRSSTKS